MVVGYITAAAVLIMANQVQNISGIPHPGASTFADVVMRSYQALPQIHGPTVALSLLTGAIFLALRRWFAKLPNVAITLVLASLIAVGIQHFGLSAGDPGRRDH